MIWSRYENFSSPFLARRHDLVLYHIFHHIKAFLLFPWLCSCGNSCRCHELRNKIALSLNTALYNKALNDKNDRETLQAMKMLWGIPDDHYFRENQGEAYPVWFIEQELRQREKSNHFKIVSRLIWTLLRLAKTYEATPFKKPQASLTEAIDIILGKSPLKRKKLQKEEDYLGGEKAYLARFNHYKSVCHLIGALEFEKECHSLSSLNEVSRIKTFLETAHWLRKELLRLETPNIKMNSLFLEESLLPLPSGIKSDRVNISLDPFQEKLQEIESFFQRLTAKE